jgi:hypothetical protein
VFEIDDGEKEGGGDGAAPHHLVGRSGDEIKSDALHGGGEHIAEGAHC